MFRSAAFISIGIAVFSFVGCGGDNSGGPGDGDSGDGDISLGDGDGDTGQGANNGGIDGCAPYEAQGCTGITYEGENVPLDIYVMFDLSCSMSCTADQSGCCKDSNDVAPESEWRIKPVRDAMKLFLEDPQSAGIGVGLGFFGDHDINDNNNPELCTVAAHTDAEVAIEMLPDAAPALVNSLQTNGPQGGTPTHLGIAGACEYTNAWKEQNPAHKVVILLVTDGIPEYSCRADIRQAIDAATDCYADGDGRELYVLGVVANNNNSLDQLHGIAEAGGTEQAYLTDSADVAGSVLAALNAIRADAVIPCTINVPEPPTGMIDYGQVNVGICDAAGDTVQTYFVPEPADCENGAWYYEQLGDEQVVKLCDETCETVSVSGAALTLSVGCATVVEPIR